MRKALLLNADYTILGVLSWQKAIVMSYRGVVSVVAYYSDFILDSRHRQYALPAVLVLRTFIKMKYKQVPLTKRNVLARDHFRCAYCHKILSYDTMTIDHVVPKSKWGNTNYHCWTNVVSACKRCNGQKGNKNLVEANLSLWQKPYKPTYSDIFLASYNSIPKEWAPYVNT